jgi:hypothetical protein
MAKAKNAPREIIFINDPPGAQKIRPTKMESPAKRLGIVIDGPRRLGILIDNVVAAGAVRRKRNIGAFRSQNG